MSMKKTLYCLCFVLVAISLYVTSQWFKFKRLRWETDYCMRHGWNVWAKTNKRPYEFWVPDYVPVPRWGPNHEIDGSYEMPEAFIEATSDVVTPLTPTTNP